VDQPPSDLSAKLRHAPTQARSRERLRRVLDAADEVLARDGAPAFTTTRVAQVAGVPVGSIYRFFPGKDAIAEALAVRYWSDFEDLVAAVAETDERDPLPDPAGAVLKALSAGFRARPGFLALWYGGLRTERIRDATRPTREAIARSVQRILAVHWPQAGDSSRATAAQMVVIAGDGLLREAFRGSPQGDPEMLEESRLMLDAYTAARLAGKRPA
jgi:AcrR family transcriptional regulator